MSIPPKLIYRFNAILIEIKKITAEFFVELNKLIVKFTWRDKRTKRTKEKDQS